MKHLRGLRETLSRLEAWNLASETMVARFILVHDTKTGKNVPNEHEMYQMVIKYPKCL
jgi:hypothetical protein